MANVRIEANQLLAILWAAYPVETVNVGGEQALAAAEVYACCLQDIEARVVVAAVEYLIKTSDRMPTVAHIRRAAVDMTYGPPRLGGDAWGDLRSAMSKHAGGKHDGGIKRPGEDFQFADPIVARVVDRLGWWDLLASENRVADRARFIELYDELAEQERVIAAAAPGLATKELAPPAAPPPMLRHLWEKHESDLRVIREAEKHAPPRFDSHEKLLGSKSRRR